MGRISTTIDSLHIEIQSSSANASSNLDRLTDSLKRLKTVGQMTQVTNSLSRLSTSLNAFQASSSAIGRLGQLASRLQQLSSIGNMRNLNSAVRSLNQLPSAMAGLSHIDASGVEELVAALRPLEAIGRAGNFISTINALRRLPTVIASLNPTTLANFTARIQQLIAALQPLAATLAPIHLAMNALPRNLNRVVNATDRAADNANGLTISFRALHAQLLAVYYATQSFQQAAAGWLHEAMNYEENVNLFTVSMGKYYEEAMAYAEAVSDAFGIDVSQWIRNQGVFMSMLTGFGHTTDAAYEMSKGLTELAYDLSSFFNIALDSEDGALFKVQSGIAGELEPLRRLGFALSEASLQEVAFANGVDLSIEKMTEAQKATLRYTAMVQQAADMGVIGDLSRTLVTPANMVRILQQQFTQLARALGQVFIPILQVTLPWIQAITIVLTEAAQALALFMGFEMAEIDYSGIEPNNSIGPGAVDTTGIDNLAGSADDAGSAMKGAKEAAEELKSATLGFDQLNIIRPEKASGGSGGSGGSGKGGGGGAGGLGGNGFGADLGLELESLWDTTMLENVNEKAESIVKTLKEFIKQIRTLTDLIWDFREIIGAGIVLFALTKLWQKVKTIWAAFLAIKIIDNLLTYFRVLRMEGKSFGQSVTGSLDEVRRGFSNMQKAAVVGIAAVLELMVVKSAVEGMLLDTKGLAAGFTEIAIAVGLAAGAMYLMLGPVGLVIAGATALVGVLWGASAAAAEMRKQMALDAFFSEGAYSLNLLAEGYTKLANAITLGMDKIVKFADDMKVAKANAESAADSVDDFAYAIELGAYTAEEAIPEILRELGTLASEAETLMDATYQSITTALIGSFGQSLEAMGHDVPETVAMFREVYTEAKGELGKLELTIADLNKQYENGALTSEEYATKLTGLTDEYRDLLGLDLPKFTDDLHGLKDGLDWSDLEKDGMLDSKKVDAFFSGISKTAGDATKEVNKYFDDIKESLNNAKSWSDDPAYKLKIDELLALNEEARGEQLGKVNAGLTDIFDTLQGDLVAKIETVADTARKEYGDLPWWQKLFMTEEQYVSGALKDYEENVAEPMNEKIKDSFDELGIKGEVWGLKAMSSVHDSMFDWSVTGEGSALVYGKDAASAINSVLEDMGKDTLPIAEQVGTDTMDGYFNAAEDEVKNREGDWKKWFGWLPQWAKDILGIKSPSTVFYSIGSDTWQGFWNASKEKWTSLQGWFQSTVQPKLTKEYWKGKLDTVRQGVNDKLNEVKTAVTTKWNELRNWYTTNIAPKFTKEYWKGKFNGIVTGAQAVLSDLKKNFEGFSAKIKTPHMTWTTTPATGIVKKTLQALDLPTSLPKLSVKWYAEGGLPDMGELFVAREAGPELVGSIGHHSAVANNDQIVTAVSEGVYRAVVAGMGQSSGSGEIVVRVYLDGKQITGAVEKTQAERGKPVMGNQLGYGWN